MKPAQNILSFRALGKAHPAKASVPARPAADPATVSSFEVRQCVSRLIDAVQILIQANPHKVELLEQWASLFRSQQPSPTAVQRSLQQLRRRQETPPMSPGNDASDDARASSIRIAELIHTLTFNRPHVLVAIERCLRTWAMDEQRRALIDRLQRLDPEVLAEVDVLLTHLENRGAFDPQAPSSTP